MSGHSLKFTIGMVLLLTNQVVGWAGLGLGAYFGRKTGKKIFYEAGAAVYAFSWAMVAAGAYLAGTEGISLAKSIVKTYLWETLAVAAVVASGAAYYYFKVRKKECPPAEK